QVATTCGCSGAPPNPWRTAAPPTASAVGRCSTPSRSTSATRIATRWSVTRSRSLLGRRGGLRDDLGHREKLEDLLAVLDLGARADELEDLFSTPHLAHEDRADEPVLQKEQPLVVAGRKIDLDDALSAGL